MIPKFKEVVDALDAEDVVKDNNNKHSVLMAMAALTGELFVDGERDKAYDLFFNASKAFGLHSVYTGMALLLAEKEMEFTDKQLKVMIRYLLAAVDRHEHHKKLTKEMAQVFADDLKNRGGH